MKKSPRQTLQQRIARVYSAIQYHAAQLLSGTPRHGRSFHATALVSDYETIEALRAKAVRYRCKEQEWMDATVKSAHAISGQALQPA